MLRFSLAALFGLIVLVGVACAALANPTQLWEQTLFTGTVVALIAIAIGAACARRPILIGCALAGWGYFIAASPFEQRPSERLLTGWVTNKVVSAIYPGEALSYEEVMMRMIAGAPTEPALLRTIPARPSPSVWTIAHMVWLWLFGLAGGVLGAWCGRKREVAA